MLVCVPISKLAFFFFSCENPWSQEFEFVSLAYTWVLPMIHMLYHVLLVNPVQLCMAHISFLFLDIYCRA